MLHPVSVKGFEDRQLAIKSAGLLLIPGPKLMIDGKFAPKGSKSGQYLLHRNDGTEIVAQLRYLLLGFDPIPQLIIGDQIIKVVEPLKWYQWIWSALSFLLLFFGGAVGGLCGGIAFTVNIRIFHSNMSNLAKYAMSAIVSIVAVIATCIFPIAVA